MKEASTQLSDRADAPSGFNGLGLSAHLLETVTAAGYVTPTPIQSQAIPHVLDGRDLLGCAQTGTGKTAAFALPILQSITSRWPDRRGAAIRCLVLAPTRELALQIATSFTTYAGRGGPRALVVYGGVSKQNQIRSLRRDVDVLVATPGRLLDIMNDGAVELDRVETFVLDEADRMLDMGFIHDVRRITRALPQRRQTLLFSATLPREIQDLAGRILHDPVRVAVDPVASTGEPTAQSVYFVEKAQKTALLVRLLGDADIDRALVFTRTKHGANRVVKRLLQANVRAAAIHGNKSQATRQRVLEDFKARRTRVVVATDIAARGIDIKDLSHVINFDLPNEPESYVHRVGRTGRAGASGVAVSFCSREERGYLRDIERLTRQRIEACATPEGLARTPSERSPSSGDRDHRSPRAANGPGRQASRRDPRSARPPRRRRQGQRGAGGGGPRASAR